MLPSKVIKIVMNYLQEPILLAMLVLIHVPIGLAIDVQHAHQPSVETNSSIRSPIEAEANTRSHLSSRTYPGILKKILPAMLGRISADETMAILEEHFFTSKKEDSVWPLAINETLSKFHATFDARTLFDMQTAVKNIYRKLLECRQISKARRRAKQTMSVVHFIEEGLLVFALPRQSDKDQAYLLELNLAFNVMAIAVLQVVKVEVDNGKLNDMTAAKMILDIGEDLFDTLEALTENAMTWRVNEIDQPEICTMQRVLWQTFPVSCHYSGVSFRSKRQVDEFLAIGGTSNKLDRLYRVHVVDKLTGTNIFNETMSAPKHAEKSIPEKLISDAEKARNSFVDKLEAEMETFYQDRTLLIHKEVQNMWDKNKLKLKSMKDRIENKHLI